PEDPAYVPQNWNLTANSACRDGALMFGSSDVTAPNSGRPVVASLPLPMLLPGMLKFARSKMLNNCAMNSARPAPPTRKNFENRRSTFTKVGQSTCDTGVRLRAVRNELMASRLSERHPDIGITPGGRSEFAGADTDVPDSVSLLRSRPDVIGPNGRLDRKSPIAEN